MSRKGKAKKQQAKQQLAQRAKQRAAAAQNLQVATQSSIWKQVMVALRTFASTLGLSTLALFKAPKYLTRFNFNVIIVSVTFIGSAIFYIISGVFGFAAKPDIYEPPKKPTDSMYTKLIKLSKPMFNSAFVIATTLITLALLSYTFYDAVAAAILDPSTSKNTFVALLVILGGLVTFFAAELYKHMKILAPIVKPLIFVVFAASLILSISLPVKSVAYTPASYMTIMSGVFLFFASCNIIFNTSVLVDKAISNKLNNRAIIIGIFISGSFFCLIGNIIYFFESLSDFLPSFTGAVEGRPGIFLYIGSYTPLGIFLRLLFAAYLLLNFFAYYHSIIIKKNIIFNKLAIKLHDKLFLPFVGLCILFVFVIFMYYSIYAYGIFNTSAFFVSYFLTPLFLFGIPLLFSATVVFSTWVIMSILAFLVFSFVLLFAFSSYLGLPSILSGGFFELYNFVSMIFSALKLTVSSVL
jgi:hypothetical protein